MDNISRIKELVLLLNNASRDYYNGIESELTDAEFDKLFEELQQLEKETGLVMSNSPTQNVGYETITAQNKVTHVVPMLSLAKCHSAAEVVEFARGEQMIGMFKMDGISLRATYNNNGDLVGLESRGNGIEGSDLYYQRYAFKNIPLHIDVTRETIIDGEAIITDADFKAINELLPESERYSHSRNLASGSLALLDTSISSQRNLRMIVWDVIKGHDSDFLSQKLRWAESLGFDVVEHLVLDNVSEETINHYNDKLFDYAKDLGYGIDGIVWKFNSVDYGKSLGRTSHHFNSGIAFKREMEVYKTTLEDIIWQTSKTGAINPVAKFKAVDLGGAMTTRATLHNISYIEGLSLGIGDTIGVIRSNEVIPRVVDNYDRSNTFEIPTTCPCCKAQTEIRNDNGSKMLYCTGTNCNAQLLGRLSHAVSRNALNIDGFSESTINSLINMGWLNSIKDIYYLSEHKEQMEYMNGFGVTSVKKLLDAIEESRNTTLDRLIYSLSIPLVGRTASKDISKYCHGDEAEFVEIMDRGCSDLSTIDGVGAKMVQSLKDYWKVNRKFFIDMITELHIQVPSSSVNVSNDNSDSTNDTDFVSLHGKTFCITGKVTHFSNRDAFVENVEKHHGKYLKGVSSKLDYLVNNDVASTSGKNKKMHELGKADHIISEEDYLKMVGEL